MWSIFSMWPGASQKSVMWPVVSNTGSRFDAHFHVKKARRIGKHLLNNDRILSRVGLPGETRASHQVDALLCIQRGWAPS